MWLKNIVAGKEAFFTGVYLFIVSQQPHAIFNLHKSSVTKTE